MNESEETVCSPSEHNEHFTRQIPDIGSIVKPSNEHFKMHIPVLNSDSSTHTETFVKTEFLPTCGKQNIIEKLVIVYFTICHFRILVHCT